MQIAPTLEKELRRLDIHFDTIQHNYADTSLNAAKKAHVPASQMVKPVILEDEMGYVMALIPASESLRIGMLNDYLDRTLGLATEDELGHLFKDCELGAIPPVGEAYGMTTVVDYHLDDCDDVYIEAGNHRDLLHITGRDFYRLMMGAGHAPLCYH